MDNFTRQGTAHSPYTYTPYPLWRRGSQVRPRRSRLNWLIPVLLGGAVCVLTLAVTWRVAHPPAECQVLQSTQQVWPQGKRPACICPGPTPETRYGPAPRVVPVPGGQVPPGAKYPGYQPLPQGG